MSGQEVAVGAGLFIMTVGILADLANEASPAKPAVVPKPVPTHTVVIHQATEHVVTRVVGGSPLAGWEIMLVAIAAIFVAAGVAIAMFYRRPE